MLVLSLCGFYGYRYFQGPDSNRITIFTSDDCGEACTQATEWLTMKNAAFLEVNIDQSEENLALWKRAGHGQILPLAFFGKTRFDGFNDLAYEIALTGFLDKQNGTVNQTVIVYTQPGCPGCKKALEFFAREEIEYEEYDIQEPENYEVYRELFGRGTPLIFIGNIRLDGFNDKTLKMALKEVDLL